MKRYKFTLAMVIAGAVLVVPASFSVGLASAASVADSDAPYPTPVKKKPVPPICTPTKAVVTAGGVANIGICRDRNGNKVWGAQWAYKDLKVAGLADTGCPVKNTTGSTGVTGRIPIAFRGVTVTYTATIWVRKTTKHLASDRSNPRSTKSFTVTIPGKPALCSGTPPVVNDNPYSPTGSGNGGSAQNGWVCGWGGSKQLSINSAGVVSFPPIDCSGNGYCTWMSDNGRYERLGWIVYTGSVECSNNVSATPGIRVNVVYPDQTACTMGWFGGVLTAPLPSNYGWYGDATIETIMTSGSKVGSAGVTFPKLTLGPITGKGTRRLC